MTNNENNTRALHLVGEARYQLERALDALGSARGWGLWDILGGGQYIAMSQWEGEPGTHSEYVEALMALDMKKTSDELAVYCKDCA